MSFAGCAGVLPPERVRGLRATAGSQNSDGPPSWLTECKAAGLLSPDPGPAGSVYLLHFARPYEHARHYLGKPASSGLLKGRTERIGGEFVELTIRVGR